MKAQVVGLENVDYKSKKTEKPVVGVKLHCLIEPNKNTQGAGVESFFISLNDRNENAKEICEVLKSIKLNSYVDITYNRFGFIDNVYPCVAK